MANETIAQVPTDVTDPVVLKRFLSRLVERLDVTLGYRGSDASASTSTVNELAKTTSESISSLTKTTSNTTQSLTELSTSVGTLEETVATQADQLGQLQAYQLTELRDFSVDSWPIYSYFTCLGSEVINPPITLVPTDSYTFFCTVLPSFTQTVMVLDNTGATAMKYRSGLTWAGVITNAWT